MKKFMEALDGWKRIIVLVLALVQLWLANTHNVDITEHLRIAYAVLGWDATGLLPVPVAVLGTTVIGAIAIADGVKKALAERASHELPKKAE